ncbi:unnamed protein product [Brachionus calyciflorus]|uniref:tRNA-specific adenosine deaminase 1 n=1 Tax=Brachionus calyciflorus TaxID=104777 RepID=A0A813M469_9BILA|nr:unnamed protein product [Brachionus calyciflorus]
MVQIDFDKIAKCCYEFYDRNILIKSKPAKNEWTNLAAILVTKDHINYKVLSMATGSKCLAEKQLPLNGSLVHDSHAEVLARRCFNRFFLYFLLHIHLASGDSSIIPKSTSLKREHEDEETVIKRLKTDENIDDIHRTGAKCVPNSLIQDPKEQGVLYHITGVVRIKPGRGDPTISMSCSDKIAKWLVLGIQGALLSNLIKEPIYLDTIVIGKCPYSEESIQRGLIDRSKAYESHNSLYKLNIPIIGQSKLLFKDSKLAKNPEAKDNEDDSELKACPNSVCWTYGIKTKPIFVLVKGLLQGASLKNNKKNSTNYPPICKYSFFSNFKDILVKLGKDEMLIEKKYSFAKNLELNYNQSKIEFFKIYSDWIRTNQEKYYSFTIE